MDLQLKDKVVIVSGEMNVIGESIVKTLAAEGAIPVIAGTNENDNIKLYDEVKSVGGECLQIVTDLTNADACKKLIEQILNVYGRIDGLVNNEDFTYDSSFINRSDEQFIRSLHKGLVPCYLPAHYALPALKILKGGIVNISSKPAGDISVNGTTALTREWAVELLKYGIRVNAVVISESWGQPDNRKSLTETSLKTPFENCKAATANRIANTVSFLLSERSSHTTGQLIHVGDLNDM